LPGRRPPDRQSPGSRLAAVPDTTGACSTGGVVIDDSVTFVD
jgi:hypothetical protein